jgi:hypothetical protein
LGIKDELPLKPKAPITIDTWELEINPSIIEVNHTKCDNYCKTMFNVLFLTSKSWANSKGKMYA